MIKEVSVEIRTEKHIKAYIEKNFGVSVRFSDAPIFNGLLKLCLAHSQKRDIDRKKKYPVILKLKIPIDSYERYGAYFNPNQNCLFNTMADSVIKKQLCAHLNAKLLEMEKPNLKIAVASALDMLQLDEDDWEPSSIYRFYHRYRERNNLPMLRQRNNKEQSA